MSELTERQEANVKLARRGLEAFDAGDAESVLGFLDPGVEILTAPDLINAGTYRGHEGFVRWAANWMEAWEEFRNDVKRVDPVGDDHVVVEIEQTAVGAGSGIHVSMTIAYLFEVRQGKATRLHLYSNRDAALAAAQRLAGDGVA